MTLPDGHQSADTRAVWVLLAHGQQPPGDRVTNIGGWRLVGPVLKLCDGVNQGLGEALLVLHPDLGRGDTLQGKFEILDSLLDLARLGEGLGDLVVDDVVVVLIEAELQGLLEVNNGLFIFLCLK